MVRTQSLLTRRHGTNIEGLSLGILGLGDIEQRQSVETGSDVSMVWPEEALPHRQALESKQLHLGIGPCAR